MNDIAVASATELSAAMRSGALASIDLVRSCLDRIATHDPAIGAVLAVCPDAVAQATASDDHRRSHPPRPLEGLPVLVKDNIAVTGLPTTAGSRALADSCPPDAELVTRLRAAGAVILAKTNLSEWANFRSTSSTSGWSAVGGQTRNPHDPLRNPSGSSSGSAAGVGAGLAPMAVGTETDGSIVSPAAMCGIVGFKPTIGSVPGAGIVPISSAQDVAGPMARSVLDAAALFAVLGGRAVPDLSHATLSGARVGVWTPDAAAGSDVLRNATDVLAGAGARLVDVQLESEALEADEWACLLSEFHAEIDAYLSAAPGGTVRDLAALLQFNRDDPLELSLFGQEIFEQALAAPPVSDPVYRERRAQVTSAARTMLDDVLSGHGLDVIVTVSNDPAGPIDYPSGDRHVVSTTSPAAVAGYPSVTVPAGRSDGMPVGISLIGAAGEDDKLLKLAASFEAALTARSPDF